MAMPAKKASPIMSAAGRKSWETRRARMLNPPKKRVAPKVTPVKKIVLPKEVPVVSAKDMMLRTVVFALSCHSYGNRRKIDSELIEFTNLTKTKSDGEVDKESVHATKKLLESEELDEIQSLYGKVNQWVRLRSLPFHIKDGIYLLPKAFDEEVEAHMTEELAKLKPLVENLIGRMSEYKQDAKKRLAHLYNPDDYPTAAELRAAFDIRWRFLKVDSADGVSKKVYEAEKKRTEEDWAETRENIKTLLRMQMQGLVDHMVDRLNPNEHGEKKSFHKNSLPKINEFLAALDARNITNDVQLKVIADSTRDLLKGADTELIRSDDAYRETLRQGFESIQSTLDKMVVDPTHRRIRVKD